MFALTATAPRLVPCGVTVSVWFGAMAGSHCAAAIGSIRGLAGIRDRGDGVLAAGDDGSTGAVDIAMLNAVSGIGF